jgi:hypothetical protein
VTRLLEIVPNYHQPTDYRFVSKAWLTASSWRIPGMQLAFLNTTAERNPGGNTMASRKQRNAARKNIKQAIKAAKRKQTLKHLPKKTRTALGKQAAKVRQSRQ